MDTEKLVVYKSNQVIEAGYKLSLNEQRIVLACIGQVNSKEELLKTDEFELSAKDFAKIFGVSDKTAYEALIEVTDSLFNRYIVINNPFPHKPNVTHLKTRWISSIYYAENEGKITLCFAEKILPYLSQLEGTFTKYELRHIGNMTSIYAIRLYELLMQWKNKGKREIEIGWLRKQFEIENLYPAMCDFKKRVIDPAVKDINTHSNFSVQWEQRKTGRAVTHLIFTFAEKNPPEPEQPHAAATPAAPPKAATQLTAEQQVCFDWASNHPYWQKFTKTQKSFLTCFNKEVEGGLKDQWLDTLPKPAKPKKEKSAAALKREAELVKVNLQNALASLEKLNKLSPNPAIANQIVELKQQLAERMKK
jgi:plasmid replication initiation protein